LVDSFFGISDLTTVFAVRFCSFWRVTLALSPGVETANFAKTRRTPATVVLLSTAFLANMSQEVEIHMFVPYIGMIDTTIRWLSGIIQVGERHE
jgi:hypothetical protein